MIKTKLKRQKYAFDCIEEGASNYKSTIENFGLIIYKNGLISAMLFAVSKEKKLYKHMAEWLIQHPLINQPNTNGFFDTLVNLSPTNLMAITEEALLLSDALKEFVKADIKTTEDE